jgi:hypothetical protein
MTTYEEVKKLAEAEVIRLTGEEARELWGRVHKEAIEPNAIEIVNIVATGDIAVVAWDLYPTSLDAAESMGYDGKAPVFRLSNKKRKFAAQRFREMGDHVSANWFARRATNRIFLMAQLGTYLLNIDTTTRSLEVEPGSLTHEDDLASLQRLIGEWAEKN